MKLEIDMPEHHYNNIIAFDSVTLGRVPYKGIIMYAINAIKRGKTLEQEPVKKLEEQIKQLQNRCHALTHGQICVFCLYECEHKAESEEEE